jgi:hypothetical protein
MPKFYVQVAAEGQGNQHITGLQMFSQQILLDFV